MTVQVSTCFSLRRGPCDRGAIGDICDMNEWPRVRIGCNVRTCQHSRHESTGQSACPPQSGTRAMTRAGRGSFYVLSATTLP